MSDVKFEFLEKVYAILTDLTSKLTFRKISEREIEVYGDYEYLMKLYEILKALGFETYLEREYVDGFKTYYLRVILH